MFYKKMFWALLAAVSFVANEIIDEPWLLMITVFALVMWAQAAVFHLSYDATLAAIKHYDATTADIEEYEEDDFESEHQDTTLDSDTFLRRIKSMDEFS